MRGEEREKVGVQCSQSCHFSLYSPSPPPHAHFFPRSIQTEERKS
jgi:hypothetical protein